jgi:hypothetical protein
MKIRKGFRLVIDYYLRIGIACIPLLLPGNGSQQIVPYVFAITVVEVHTTEVEIVTINRQRLLQACNAVSAWYNRFRKSR